MINASTERDCLVLENRNFVAKIAREYSGLGLSFDDLLGEGNIGLIEAARRFDPSRGNRFITYAVWWIRKQILEALSQRAHLVRVPANRALRSRRILETEKRLAKQLGRQPDADELSRATGESLRTVDRAKQLPRRIRARPRPDGADDPVDPLDLVQDPSWNVALERLLDGETSRRLEHGLAELEPRERLVLGLRSGLDERGRMTLRELAQMMKLSRERVRQIEAKAAAKMRRYLKRSG